MNAGPGGEDIHRLHPLSPLLRSGVFVVAWLGWLVHNGWNGIDSREVALSGGVVLMAGLGLGGVSWWFTRYRINAEEILIESGVLRRQSRRIAISRLQAVELQQPLLGRIFGMAELSLETAGGGPAARLAYLRVAQAIDLRRQLLGPFAGSRDQVEPLGSEPVLFAVRRWRLLGSQFLSRGFAAATGGALTGVAATATAGTTVGFVVVAGAVLGVVAVVFRGFAAFSGFTVRESGRVLRVRSGLFAVRTQTVPVGRIAGFVLLEPVLWSALDWVRVDITVAGVQPGADGERPAGTLVPVAPRAEALELIRMLSGCDPVSVRLVPAPARAWLLAPLTRSRLGIGFDQETVVTTRGLLTRRTDAVPRSKIQSIRLSRGPVQRMLRLASVRIDLPSGPVAARADFRGQQEAWRLALDLAPRRGTPRREVR